MEPGDSLIITHEGSAEISLSIVCYEKGIEVSGPMNCTAQKHLLGKNGRWKENADNKKTKRRTAKPRKHAITAKGFNA